MPTPKEVLEDDNFWNLPVPERVKAMKAVDPNFAGLRGFAQLQVVGERPQPKPAGDKGFLRTLAGDVVSIPSNLFKMAQDPLSAITGAVGAQHAELGKAKEAFGRGQYVEAGGHGLAGVLPVIGPAAAQAGEEIGTGKPGEGLAHATELLAPFARKPIMRGAGAAARGVGTALSKLPTGGVVQDVAGLIFPQVAHGLSLVNRVRKIFGLEPTAEAAAAYKPFTPSAVTQRSMGKYSPYVAEYGEPGVRIPRKVPIKAPATKPFEPVRPNPNIARKLRYSPGEEPGGGPAYSRIPRRAPQTAEMPPTKMRGVPEEYQKEAAATARRISSLRQAKVDKIVKLARDSGVDPNLLENATPAQRNMLAKAADPSYKGMSDETLGHVIRELRKFTLKP